MKNKNSILYTGNRIGCPNPQPITHHPRPSEVGRGRLRSAEVGADQKRF